MIAPLSYVLSLQALKLLDKERKSHISESSRSTAGSHNPIIAQARLDQLARPIPWLAGKHLRLTFK
jgi:hypothetical protein